MIIKEKCDDASPLFHRDQEWRVGRLGCSSWGSFKIEVPLITGGNIFVSIIMPPGVLETQLHTVGDGSSQKRQMEHVRMLGSRSFNCTWNHLLPPFSHSPWDSEFDVLLCSCPGRTLTLTWMPPSTLSLKLQKSWVREKYYCGFWSQC